MHRRALGWPITLGVVMILLVAALAAGWVILSLYGALDSSRWAPLFWTLLTVGSALFVLVLVGVVLYLILSIKAINLNQRQSNFIDSVTHELKSPIASLKLYLQTLGRHEVDREEQERFYRHMLEDVERLDQLINHLLDAARLDRLTDRRAMEEIDLSPVLQECAAAVAARYHLPPQSVRIETESCVLRAPPVDLELIFSNLIDNAAKYASETDPAIAVSLRAEENWAVAHIADNGRGIPRHLRKKIFGRFVRLGMELERKKTGTGLGLYIVRTLVRRLKGKVAVLDGEGGQGTIFEVRLPLVRGRVEKKPQRQDDTPTKREHTEPAHAG
jgi:two-component system, OmpR family, phosphate regulon sensor histidine kinase PhoR